MSSRETLSSDFGSRTVTKLGPGLGTGWDRIQAWDQTAVGSRPGDMLDSVPGPRPNLFGFGPGDGLDSVPGLGPNLLGSRPGNRCS